jgi:hypothetical protein
MKTRAFASCLVAILGALTPASAATQEKPAGAGVEARLPAYLANYLSFDPASKITAERAPDTLPGFQSYKIKRTGKYPKLAVDKTVYVSNDGKWFYDGESSPQPRPVRRRGPRLSGADEHPVSDGQPCSCLRAAAS